MSHTAPWPPAPQPRDHSHALPKFNACEDFRSSAPTSNPIITTSATPVKDSCKVPTTTFPATTYKTPPPPSSSSPSRSSPVSGASPYRTSPVPSASSPALKTASDCSKDSFPSSKEGERSLPGSHLGALNGICGAAGKNRSQAVSAFDASKPGAFFWSQEGDSSKSSHAAALSGVSSSSSNKSKSQTLPSRDSSKPGAFFLFRDDEEGIPASRAGALNGLCKVNQPVTSCNVPKPGVLFSLEEEDRRSPPAPQGGTLSRSFTASSKSQTFPSCPSPKPGARPSLPDEDRHSPSPLTKSLSSAFPVSRSGSPAARPDVFKGIFNKSQSHSEALNGIRETCFSTSRGSPPRGAAPAEEEEEEEEEDEEEGSRASADGLRTGRSQSKAGYSRMWEDPVGERNAIPLYNRLHFSTVPRKAVTKKTWYLVHNTYASLQNGNGHPHQHPHHHLHSQQHAHHHHPHHHPLAHHPTHPFANGARMEEVGGDEFRSHNHAERLMRKMETCASKRQLCDVVLIAGPKRLPAHRLVLSAASDYFAAMFMNNVREATMEEVELKDVDPEALAALVQYTYTGRIELKEETVECLLSTACLLQLSEVVEACCSFLMKQLHPSNCIGIRQFADAQGCTDLYKVANNYVMEMFVEVMHNSEFLMLPCDEVCKLLASDDLNVPNEETIFEALVKWAKHDLTARRKNLSKLLAHIKLPLMSPQYIADHVETNSLFREDRECQQLIMEALKYHLLPERRSSFQSPRTKPRKSTVGVLYAVGGMDCTKGATSIEKYELRTNTWTQVANMSGRRLQFGVAVLEDRLYVVGGRDGLKTLNTVECYDPKKKTWTLMPPMSTHRHGLGVGVLEGPMYAVGGHDGWSYLNTVERWDPQARQWSYVAPMSTARSTVGVASLHGKLYAVGGRDGSSCLKSVECFDPHTNKWTHCTPMAKRRGGVGVATCNGFLYAVGGHEAPATNPTCSRYDSAERYDPKTDQWTNISPISSPRDAVGLCPLGDKLFAVGGYDGQQYLNDVECYDPMTNEWIKVSSLCTGRAGACVVHVPNS